MLAFLKGMGEYIAGTVAGKAIVVAVAAGAVATGATLAVNNTAQAKPQVKTTSSIVMEANNSMTSSVVSSADTSSALNAINQATSDGVSKVQAAASSAVSQVQAAASSAAAPATPTTPTVTVEKKIISWVDTVSEANYAGNIDFVQPIIDASKKTITVNYGGTMMIKPEVTLKNSAGTALATDKGKCTFTIPYNNLSDISTLYLCSHDQQIKITVS